MAIQNWIRCHWRNGRQVLHDVPEAWNDEIEAHLRRHRARTRDLGMVRTATLDSVEIAWIECEVPLGSPGGDLTYRRARAVHALVRARGEAPAWTPKEASSLFLAHYGEAVDKGLASQHRVLSKLSHPEDRDCAAGLFVGADAPLPTALDPDAGAGDRTDAARGLGYAQRHLIDAWEEWVAEGRRPGARLTPLNGAMQRASAPTPVPTVESIVVAAESRAAAAPHVAPEPPKHEPMPVAPEPPVPVAAEPPVPEPMPDATEPLLPPIEPRQPLAAAPAPEPAPPVAPLPPATPLVADDETEPDEIEEKRQLFDLTSSRHQRPDAPKSSLSGLLGPSYTTSLGG